MSKPQHHQDPDMAQTAVALKRAARKARELAERTRTPLVIYRDGKVEKLTVSREAEIPPSTE